jgi:3',5'-nucleoside bisphosphate phosphatase
VTIADLHVHTTVTDGRMRPAEVIDLAARAGVQRLVFTDHSAVTFPEVLDHAAANGVDLPFPGMEVSTYLGHRKHHVLLYGWALLDRELQRVLRFPVENKLRIAQRVRDELASRGYNMAPLEAIRTTGSADGRPTPEKLFPSRTAIAWHLSQCGGMPQQAAYALVASIFSAAERAGQPGLADRYLPTLDVIRLAAGRGLATALAHPLWECTAPADVDGIRADIRTMAEAGLHGMETRSYHHRPLDDHPALLRLRSGLGLLPAGGSDFHGNGKTELGADGLDRPEFAALAALVARGGNQLTPSGAASSAGGEQC